MVYRSLLDSPRINFHSFYIQHESSETRRRGILFGITNHRSEIDRNEPFPVCRETASGSSRGAAWPHLTNKQSIGLWNVACRQQLNSCFRLVPGAAHRREPPVCGYQPTSQTGTTRSARMPGLFATDKRNQFNMIFTL